MRSIRQQSSAASLARPTAALAHASDLALVQCALAGEVQAIDEFLLRMRCVDHFVARRNLRCGRPLGPDALRDLVQDVIAAVWQRLEEYQGDAGLETWVYRFCDLTFRNALRRASPRRTVPLLDDVPDPRGGASPSGPDRQRVAELLRSLSSVDVRILRLKHFEMLTFEAMAAHLRQSPNTLKTRYYRALAKLRRGLRRLPALIGSESERVDGSRADRARLGGE